MNKRKIWNILELNEKKTKIKKICKKRKYTIRKHKKRSYKEYIEKNDEVMRTR